MKRFLLFFFAIAMLSSCQKEAIVTSDVVEAVEVEIKTLEEIDINVQDGVVTFGSEGDLAAVLDLISREGEAEVSQFLKSKDFKSVADRYEELVDQMEVITSEDELDDFLSSNSQYLTVTEGEDGIEINPRGVAILNCLSNRNFEIAVEGKTYDILKLAVEETNLRAASCAASPEENVYYLPNDCVNGLRTRLRAFTLSFSSTTVCVVQIQSYKRQGLSCLWTLKGRYNQIDASVVVLSGAFGLSPNSFYTANLVNRQCNGCHTLSSVKWIPSFSVSSIEEVDASGASLMPFGGTSAISLQCN